MFRSISLRALIAGLSLVAAAACGSSPSTGSSSASSSSAILSAPSAPVLDLSGTWSGTLASQHTDSGSDPNPNLVSWTASQSGSSLSGPVAVSVSEEHSGEVGTQVFNGTLAGTIGGTDLTLAMMMPAGAFPDAPGCTISGSGTATPTSGKISSTLTITFSSDCVGTVSDKPTETDILTLSKQ